MKYWILCAAVVCGATGPAAAPVRAEGAAAPAGIPAVIELYTSQGCSSCPAADALLKSYVDRPDVIALSLPVDYWDYLGWKDSLASPKFSARQRAYARQRGDGRIYTPQVVVNGLEHAIGSSARDIDAALNSTAGKLSKLRTGVRLRDQKGHLIIDIDGLPGGHAAEEATVWLAIVSPRVDVEVQRGENRGRKLTYYNVVREMTPVGMWSGAPKTITLADAAVKQPGAERCAVLVQQGRAGPIVGAAMLNRW